MNQLSLKNITRHLKNERGVAALMGIVFGIIIIGSIAFNFLAESRLKQSGSILTYTSTNAFMIAEAGLRYVEKCLLEVDAAWGCPVKLQNNSDWTTILATNVPSDNFNHDFGGGNFSISFPGSVTPTHPANNTAGAPNDADNIRVIATGTFRGAERSIQRFISRSCVLSLDGATSCIGTTTNNNSSITPAPSPDSFGVCPVGGIVADLPALDVSHPCFDCVDSGTATTFCPNFSAGSHLTSGFLNTNPSNFCNMTINGDQVVKTSELVTTDNNILVAGNLNIDGNAAASLQLSNDAVDPNSTEETIITVYGNASLTHGGDIRVNGALTLKVGGTLDMKNSSKINNNQGEEADAIAMVEGNVTLKNSTEFIGAIQSDATISLENNAQMTGSMQGNEIKLRNNATLIFNPDGNPGGNTSGYLECLSSVVPPGWSE